MKFGLRCGLALTVWSAMLANGVARAAEYKLTEKNTEIKFVGAKPSGDSHTGTFKKLAGKLDLPEDATKLKLEVTIVVESIETDAGGLTNHLKTPDFFDARKYPEAKFVSKEVKVEEGKTIVSGELTMHGKTEVFAFPVKVEQGANPKLTAEFDLPRSKWGITYGQGQINENVKVSVIVDTAKKPE